MNKSFAQKIQDISPHVDTLVSLSKTLTPQMAVAIASAGRIDPAQLIKVISLMDEIKERESLLTSVSNGIESVEKVVSIQNQVQYTSDNRDSISLVAGMIHSGKLDEFIAQKKVSEDVLSMSDAMNDILSIKDKLDAVSDAKEQIVEVSFIAERMRDDIFKIEEINKQTSDNLMSSLDILGKIKIVEQRVDDKLKKVEAIEKSMKDFKVSVEFISPDKKSSSSYNSEANTLKIKLTTGKEGKIGPKGRGLRGLQGIPGSATKLGKTGKVGKNGENFSIDIFGYKKDLMKYGNRPVGTSLLSLDETPTMIYFRKSNALDHWTDGQPFGVSNGDIKLLVDNAQRLNGFTLDEIFSHVEKSVNSILNSKGQSNGE